MSATTSTTAVVEVQPVPGGRPDGGEDRPPPPGGRPRWGRWAQLAVAAVAGGLYLANLSANGLANPYYAAAVKSGSVSWKAFLFGSLDPGSFITVDKPPAAFWLQALSVRVFGYSSWSLLVPEAVAGVLATAVTYHLARRLVLARTSPTPAGTDAADAPDGGRLGFVGGNGAEGAGVLAGLALAVTPIATVMFRFNDPDALLTLFLVLAAWAGWVAIERGTIRHLVLAGFLIGMAFLSKELVAAVVVPGLALAWLLAAPIPWRRRLLGWLWGGVALVVSAGWWVALVQLWPASDRPFIGSSTDNSIISVIFGYNGFSRIFGSHGVGGGAGGRAGPGGVVRAGGGIDGVVRAGGQTDLGRVLGGRAAGGGSLGGFGGGAGWTRFFADTLGAQISWLVPLAALGLVFGLVSAGRAGWSDRRRAGYILWGGWAVAGWLVFSKSSGTFHPYYVVAVAPPIALLAAVGAVDLWAAGRRHRSLCWLLPAGVAGTGVWSYALLDRDASYHPWLRVAVLVGAGVGAVGLLLAALLPSRERPSPAGGSTRRRLGVVGVSSAAVVAAVALLAGPAAWSISSVTHGGNGTNPTAGPESAATAGLFSGDGGRLDRGAFGADGPVRSPAFGGGAFGGGAFGGGAFGGGGLRTGRAGAAGRLGGAAGAFGGAASSAPSAGDRSFVRWLEANRDGAKYLVATDGSMSADDLIIASGQPVMAMGGFSGQDPDPTLAQFERLVAGGQVRYVLLGGGGVFGGGGFGGGGTVSTVESWVEAHGRTVPTSTWGGGVSGTLYEVTPATVASSHSSASPGGASAVAS